MGMALKAISTPARPHFAQSPEYWHHRAMAEPETTAAPAPITMAHIFPSFGYGGQQSRLAALAGGLGGVFYHQIVALDGDLSARAMFSSEAPTRCRAFPTKKSRLASLSNISGLRQLIADATPDILCTYNWGSIEAVIANRLFTQVPHIHFEDGFGPGEGPAQQVMRRVLARRALLGKSVIAVPSRVLENVALNVWKLPRRNVRYLANGVDLRRFAMTSDRQAQDRVTVGSIGALRAEKNYSRLIKAVASIEAGAAIRLEIVGDGPERARLAKAIDDARMSLPGATSSPEAAYGRFDIFALSSDTEQAPLSLMEAMAAGLPVVATDVGDIADMVAAENKAFVTPLGDDAAYANALKSLAADPALRMRLGRANAEKARRDFALEKMLDAHRALYCSMTGC